MTQSRITVSEHDTRNHLHSVMLIGAMIGLCSVIGWYIWGWAGVIWLAAFGFILTAIGPRISPQLILRMYKAQPLDRRSGGALISMVEDLAHRAGLPKKPKLYYVPSRIPNAFTLGDRDNSIIAVTDGMLRGFSARELRGVLAHEISHVSNNDIKVMSMADVVSQLVNAMSWVGQILLIINLPLVMAGKAHFPWLLALLLIFAPTLTSLLQLALSRTREYDADLEAAKLTKDPRGLASALSKLERISSNVFERILMPGGRIPDPSILRTHPSAKDRIDRLLEMEEDLGLKDSYPHEPEPVRLRQRPQIKITRPRRHLTGLWY